MAAAGGQSLSTAHHGRGVHQRDRAGGGVADDIGGGAVGKPGRRRFARQRAERDPVRRRSQDVVVLAEHVERARSPIDEHGAGAGRDRLDIGVGAGPDLSVNALELDGYRPRGQVDHRQGAVIVEDERTSEDRRVPRRRRLARGRRPHQPADDDYAGRHAADRTEGAKVRSSAARGAREAEHGPPTGDHRGGGRRCAWRLHGFPGGCIGTTTATVSAVGRATDWCQTGKPRPTGNPNGQLDRPTGRPAKPAAPGPLRPSPPARPGCPAIPTRPRPGPRGPWRPP